MNDANSCFEQIRHTFAVLVLMYYGVAWSVASTLFEVLQKAKHKIQTSYGVSAPVYGDKETAISGIGQGNGLGPAIWALISSIIFMMCKARGHGMNMTTAISKREISFMGFAFVDDADLVTGAEDINTSRATMITRFQAMTPCWIGGIRATGGLIVPEKTRWFLIAFFCDGLDWAYHTKESLPGDIYLPDKNGDLYTVTRDEPTSEHMLLGMQRPLSGGDSDRGVKFSEGAHLFASQIRLEDHKTRKV